MDLLTSSIRHKTSIPQTYRDHAGLPSIDAYLRDWRKAHELLGRRIEALTALRDERNQQIIRGEWPPPRPEPEPEPARPPVRDLLGELAASIDAAKAARQEASDRNSYPWL